MGALLEAVTLDDWRAIVNSAKALAQAGDSQARAWLAQSRMGKPEAKAPTPLTVVVQQWSGLDPLIDRKWLRQPSTARSTQSSTAITTSRGESRLGRG